MNKLFVLKLTLPPILKFVTQVIVTGVESAQIFLKAGSESQS